MQLYDGSLNKYLDKLNISKNFFTKTDSAMSIAYLWQIGFFHNDIHLGNILLNLIQKSKEPEALIYEIKNIKYTVETIRKLILSDFGKSKYMISIYYH